MPANSDLSYQYKYNASECFITRRGNTSIWVIFFGALFCQRSNYEQIVNFEILKGFFILFLYHNIIGTTINSTKEEEPICLKSSLKQRN